MTDFPNNPNIGDTYGSDGALWEWDGSAWVTSSLLFDVTVPQTFTAVMTFTQDIDLNRELRLKDLFGDVNKESRIRTFGDILWLSSTAVGFFVQVDDYASFNFDGGAITLSLDKVDFGNTKAAIIYGDGAPEGVVEAQKGSLYLRGDGAAGETLYVKTVDGGNTGWVVK